MARTTTRSHRRTALLTSLLLGVSALAAGPAAATAVARVTSDPPIFSDDFTTGDFSMWTAHASRMTIDTAGGSPAAPSARLQATNQSAWAYRTLASTYEAGCLSANVNIVSGTSFDLFSLRTATNGVIERLHVGTNGVLQVRSTYQRKVWPALGTGWHNVEICVGTAPGWSESFYLDGNFQSSVTSASHDTGPIGRIQLGDTSSSTTAQASFDHVVFDQFPGDLGPDQSPPTVPGRPTATSVVPRTVDLSWAASTDDRSTVIGYHIFRDGDPHAIGTVWDETSFTDTGLTPGTSHTYTIVAEDAAQNLSDASQPSVPITVLGPPAATFTDDFSTGTFAGWSSVTRLAIDNTSGDPSAPSARAQVTGQSAFAYRNLATPMTTACLSVSVNLVSGSGVDLFRLRTASNGPIIKVLVRPTGRLQIRSDFAGTSLTSDESVGTGWHNLELCGTVGSASVWNLYHDEHLIESWNADTGTTPIGRIQIGDTAAKTFTAGFDDVVLDQYQG